ncbi:MAG: hypothetical protein KDD45_00520 [Bdellovibrionales bacterium]|nr:hypothetical protein [Bdellovibrionales bacterium]
MDILNPWIINSKVLPTGLQILLLFHLRLKNNPNLQAKKILGFSRKDLARSTGLSYNTIQSGLRELERLGFIQLDPLNKGSKQLVRITEPTEYNWELIQERLGFHFKPIDTDKK